MDINRNQYFMAGVVILLLGVQFRMIDSYVLNEQGSQFVTQKLKQGSSSGDELKLTFISNTSIDGAPRQMIRPPEWLGWALISVGAVLCLHALAMKKPD